VDDADSEERIAAKAEPASQIGRGYGYGRLRHIPLSKSFVRCAFPASKLIVAHRVTQKTTITVTLERGCLI
jgi:hypothetical protein